MENKGLSQSNTDGAEKLLACALIAVCGVLTKTQRKQIADCLRIYAPADTPDGDNLKLKLLALAKVAEEFYIAQDLINASKILDTGLTPTA